MGVKNNKNLIDRILHNDITTLILRLLMVYVVLFITQVTFFIANNALLGELSNWSELWEVFKGSMVFNTLSILYCNILFILLSIVPFRFRENKVYQKILFWIYLISNAVGIVILNLMDVVYFPHTLKRMTAEEFHYLNNSNNGPIVIDYIKDNIILIIIAVLLIAFLVVSYRIIKYRPTKIKNSKIYLVSNLAIMLLIGALCTFGTRGSFNITKPTIPLSKALKYCPSPEKAYLVLSNPYCVIRTFKSDQYDRMNSFDDNELAKTFSPFHYPDSSRYDLGKRNVVVFIMESFSKEHSKLLSPDLYPNEQGYTPFLDSLMQHSYTFTNAYSNGTMSIEALPAVLGSIPSFKTSFVQLRQQTGDLECMPEILADKGYQTSFFCGAERNSMGFEAFARRAGVKNMFCREEYEENHPVNENTIEPFWGVYDMPFFQFMADEISTMKQPFFASVFNLSSHHPYTVPADYAEIVPQGHTPEQRVVAYTDLSVKKFFERVEKEPWYSNTIFVFVADHVSPVMYDPKTLSLKGRSAIIEFIYTPDEAIKGFDWHTTQQLDIMPTVLGLLGNEKPYFAFGRDVFNEPERKPVAVNCMNQLYQCITDSGTIYHDTDHLVGTLGRDDIYRQKVVQEGDSNEVAKTETYLKALIQSYGEHLASKNLKVIQ